VRLANVEGRAVVVRDSRLVDVERASGGRLPSDPMALVARLDEAGELPVPADAPSAAGVRLGPPVPRPQKILAVGLNYRGHARESGLEPPSEPILFAKLPSALCGPTDEIVIPAGRSRVDWEAELVAVVGRGGKNVEVADAWSYVAGLTCGQDVSDREEQFRGLRQFTMGKSYDTYAPVGPVLATPDEVANRDDLAIRCLVDGEVVQESRTSDLIFSVAELVAWASRICTLEPGDLFFTGTPAGVGDSRDPPRYLSPGNVVETEIEGIGTMRNRCVAG
jgi:2-keto-4-pentenoate hydratase/2-oxohepta-3-ene-1,7-dioic acid hydratase in catechol pathway